MNTQIICYSLKVGKLYLAWENIFINKNFILQESRWGVANFDSQLDAFSAIEQPSNFDNIRKEFPQNMNLIERIKKIDLEKTTITTIDLVNWDIQIEDMQNNV